MLDTPCSEVVRRVLATQSIRQFPLHFPSRASPCAITFQLDYTCQALLLPVAVEEELELVCMQTSSTTATGSSKAWQVPDAVYTVLSS
jgi:hypothetical protein